MYSCLETDPPWLVTAWGQLGVRELPGTADNDQVRAYHGATRAGPAPDAVPWCSSFVNWSLQRNGYAGTRSRAARSWLNWDEGVHLAHVVRGAVIVFPRGAGGHVAFALERREDGLFAVLGGNQHNQVSIGVYGPTTLGILWPRGYPLPTGVCPSCGFGGAA